MGHSVEQVYDSLGRVVETITHANGAEQHSRRAYDAFGNLISETDALGRQKVHVYAAFSCQVEDIDEDGLTSTQNQQNLVRDVVNQAQSRAGNLPTGDVQKMIIDVRGQNVSPVTLNQLARQIQQQSNRTLTTGNIVFWR